MNIQATIQIRVEEDLKTKAADVLRKMGLDLSSGIKLFLNEIITSQVLPFLPATEKGKELRYYEQYKKEIAWAKKYGKSYTSGKELMDDLMKD